MRKWLLDYTSFILAILATIIFVICVLLLQVVVYISITGINLFKGKKYGKHRVSKCHDISL
jgi:lipopolysaccharide/colanic/teichoic acid biosynthesis glycosyltransferase